MAPVQNKPAPFISVKIQPPISEVKTVQPKTPVAAPETSKGWGAKQVSGTVRTQGDDFKAAPSINAQAFSRAIQNAQSDLEFDAPELVAQEFLQRLTQATGGLDNVTAGTLNAQQANQLKGFVGTLLATSTLPADITHSMTKLLNVSKDFEAQAAAKQAPVVPPAAVKTEPISMPPSPVQTAAPKAPLEYQEFSYQALPPETLAKYRAVFSGSFTQEVPASSGYGTQKKAANADGVFMQMGQSSLMLTPPGDPDRSAMDRILNFVQVQGGRELLAAKTDRLGLHGEFAQVEYLKSVNAVVTTFITAYATGKREGKPMKLPDRETFWKTVGPEVNKLFQESMKPTDALFAKYDAQTVSNMNVMLNAFATPPTDAQRATVLAQLKTEGTKSLTNTLSNELGAVGGRLEYRMNEMCTKSAAVQTSVGSDGMTVAQRLSSQTFESQSTDSLSRLIRAAV